VAGNQKARSNEFGMEVAEAKTADAYPRLVVEDFLSKSCFSRVSFPFDFSSSENIHRRSFCSAIFKHRISSWTILRQRHITD
jgi:hypothetical protein